MEDVKKTFFGGLERAWAVKGDFYPPLHHPNIDRWFMTESSKHFSYATRLDILVGQFALASSGMCSS